MKNNLWLDSWKFLFPKKIDKIQHPEKVNLNSPEKQKFVENTKLPCFSMKNTKLSVHIISFKANELKMVMSWYHDWKYEFYHSVPEEIDKLCDVNMLGYNEYHFDNEYQIILDDNLPKDTKFWYELFIQQGLNVQFDIEVNIPENCKYKLNFYLTKNGESNIPGTGVLFENTKDLTDVTGKLSNIEQLILTSENNKKSIMITNWQYDRLVIATEVDSEINNINIDKLYLYGKFTEQFILEFCSNKLTGYNQNYVSEKLNEYLKETNHYLTIDN